MTKNSKLKAARREAELERRERIAEARRQAQRKERRKALAIVGGGVAVCLVLVGTVVGIQVNKTLDKDAANKRISGLQHFTGLATTTTTGAVTYAQSPPTGGAYSPTLLNCGVYDDPVDNEEAVHDLADGAVWITYGAHTPGTTINALKTKIRSEGLYGGAIWATLSPYPGLKASQIYLSAWGYQVQVTGTSDPRIDKFLKKFVHGKQAPNPDGKCQGGVGTPKTN